MLKLHVYKAKVLYDDTLFGERWERYAVLIDEEQHAAIMLTR